MLVFPVYGQSFSYEGKIPNPSWYTLHLEKSLYNNSRVLQKPWQAALFLGTELRPTEETLQVLQKQIQQGTLRQASVLSFAKQDGDPTGTAYLYILNEKDNISIEPKHIFPPDTPLPILLHALFVPLQATNDLYTALIINGRGDGSVIKYADDQFLLVSDITRQLIAHRLYVDVLDLQACHMGSVFAIRQLVQDSRIHYAIVSSELRRGSKQTLYYRLLNHFDKTPKQAALNAHLEFAQITDFSNDKSTHNSMVLDLSKLQQPFESWLSKPFIAFLEPGWHSLQEVLLTQPGHTAQDLAATLEKSIISQWCYSSQMHTLYKEKIPMESGCIDGINIRQDMLYSLWP